MHYHSPAQLVQAREHAKQGKRDACKGKPNPALTAHQAYVDAYLSARVLQVGTGGLSEEEIDLIFTFS